jgi:hypothetical protein
VVERLIVDVSAEPDVVLALQPIDVEYGLVLIVAPVVRHEGVDGTETGVGVQIEIRRPALVRLREVGAGQGKPHALKIYPPFGADTRAGHNLVFRSVGTWESDAFAFLDVHLRR